MFVVCGEPFLFGPRIASDEHSVREDAFAELVVWISKQSEMSDEDCDRIWEVIIHGLWKTDLVPVQNDFCRKISASIHDFPEQIAKTFIRTFFVRSSKKWGTFDRFRIDKFLVLVRCFVNRVVPWARETSNLDFLLELSEIILGLQSGLGLQLQFVDLILPYLPVLVQSGGFDGARFVAPFTTFFADAEFGLPLIKRIREKLVQPLIESEGAMLFDDDMDAALRFLRGLEGRLNTAVKKLGNEGIMNVRFETLKELKPAIVAIVKAKKASGEPVAKKIFE
jgi:hypothetical protein